MRSSPTLRVGRETASAVSPQSCFVFCALYFEAVSHWPEAHQTDQAGWPVSPTETLVSVFAPTGVASTSQHSWLFKSVGSRRSVSHASGATT